MLQANRLSGIFARSKPRATLYLSVGAQTLHAVVCEQGSWQAQSAVEIAVADGGAVNQNTAVELLLASIQLLQHRLVAGLVQDTDLTGPVDVHVSISARWLPSETLPWSDAVGSSELRMVVTDHLQQSGFLLGAQDVVRWEDAPWGSPRWVVAYPASVLQALGQLADALDGRLVSVLPAAGLVAQVFCQQHRGMVVIGHVEAGLFHLVEIYDGCVQSTMQRALDGVLPKNDCTLLTESVGRIWRSIQLRSPHLHEVPELTVLFETEARSLAGTADLKLLAWPEPEQCQVAPMLRALRSAKSTGNSLDAVVSRTPLSFGSYFLLAGASIVFFALIWVFGLNVQAIHGLESARQVARSTVVQSGPIALSKVQQDQVVAVNAAIRQLNMPVAELLRALHPPKDIRVALLGIDLSDSASEAGLPKLKLTAEALSGEDMTRYLGFLDGRRPFVQASLVRHEVMQNVSENPWRFTMELTWRP